MKFACTLFAVAMATATVDAVASTAAEVPQIALRYQQTGWGVPYGYGGDNIDTQISLPLGQSASFQYGQFASSATPTPSLSLSASSYMNSDPSNATGLDSAISASLSYYFSVIGPTGLANSAVDVPIDISGQYSLAAKSFPTASAPDAYSAVSVNVLPLASGAALSFAKTCEEGFTAPGQCGQGSFSGTGLLQFGGGFSGPYQVIMTANVESHLGYGASAYVDPYIQIDPTWAASNPGYSLVFDPGVGNALPVPEPSTLALSVLGLLSMMGLGLRRRDKAKSLALNGQLNLVAASTRNLRGVWTGRSAIKGCLRQGHLMTHLAVVMAAWLLSAQASYAQTGSVGMISTSAQWSESTGYVTSGSTGTFMQPLGSSYQDPLGWGGISTSAFPTPALSVSSQSRATFTANGSETFYSGSENAASLYYDVTVRSAAGQTATADVIVPILISGRYSYSVDQGSQPGSQATAFIEASLGSGNITSDSTFDFRVGDCASVFACTSDTQSKPFSGQVGMLIQAGYGIGTGTVYMDAGTIAYSGGSATATIDPYVYIDPSWLASHPGYTLEVTAGVGNDLLPSVPEPDTFALLLTGCAALGFANRRMKG